MESLNLPSNLIDASTLHDEAKSQSIESVLAIARLAAEMGVKIVVTNPSPFVA